ncbi:MAG: TlyA family RNA methyltransferase [Candidatus Bipolaricaulia bacterium]
MPRSRRSPARARPRLKKRLDLLLEERGLVRSRSQAQAEILAGKVLVDGVVVDKPRAMVPEGAELELRSGLRYVSRGGLKLERALQAFGIDVLAKVAIDIGASTGGFTDCLLQHGAKRVYAIDVGRGLLDWRLRRDRRVVVLEGLNARYLKPEDLGEHEPVDLATIDVSFISLKLILPPLVAIVREGGELIPLVKPQFEAGKERVKRGLVRDPRVHLEVLEELRRFIIEELGLSLLDATFSPIKGPEGNIEFFLYLRNSPGQSAQVDLEGVVAAAHAELD